jgi:hypothetical protein
MLELYTEIGHMYMYNFLLRMTDTMTSKNIDYSFLGHPVWRVHYLKGIDVLKSRAISLVNPDDRRDF